MNYDPRTDDEILQNILYRADVAAEPYTDSDEADEVMSLFIEGQLNDHDRESFFQSLDANPQLRRAVGQYLQHPAAALEKVAAAEPCQPIAEPARFRNPIATGWEGVRKFVEGITGAQRSAIAGVWKSQGGRQSAWGRPFFSRAVLACAAMLLVAVTAIVWPMLHNNSRTALLAMRGGPNLLDYGYDPDIDARGDVPAAGFDVESMLRTIRDHEERERLAAAYKLLQTNQFTKATEAFEQLGNEFPAVYYSMVGQGMAAYGDGDYKAAALKFQTALQILARQAAGVDRDSLSISARINFAIALTQLNQIDEARAEWQMIDITKLPKEERDTVGRWKSRTENTP